MKLIDVPANDIVKAMEYRAECIAEGIWTPERSRMLLQLQDNPDALIAVLAMAEKTKSDR